MDVQSDPRVAQLARPAQSVRRAGPIRTSRGAARVGLLALLSVGLLSGGVDPGGVLPDVSAAPAFRDAPAETGRLAARISTRLRMQNPSLAPSATQRMTRAILRASARHGLDPELVTAVLIVESGARPWVRSPKGALGLMQLMPHMYAGLELAGNPTTIESNIEAGCMILADNIRRLGEADGISSYFWGSEIRGVAYLARVRAERAALQSSSES